jgi:hypothetical protein
MLFVINHKPTVKIFVNLEYSADTHPEVAAGSRIIVSKSSHFSIFSSLSFSVKYIRKAPPYHSCLSSDTSLRLVSDERMIE